MFNPGRNPCPCDGNGVCDQPIPPCDTADSSGSSDAMLGWVRAVQIMPSVSASSLDRAWQVKPNVRP